eukprot:750400-Hanusia_phi.AAC.2
MERGWVLYFYICGGWCGKGWVRTPGGWNFMCERCGRKSRIWRSGGGGRDDEREDRSGMVHAETAVGDRRR